MKTLVFDLDDTLLNRNKKIGFKTQTELIRQIECGSDIVLATSRPIRAVRRFVDAELLKSITVISLNGAICHHPNGQVRRYSHIGTKAKELIENEDLRNRVHFSVELEGEHFASNATYTDQELDEVHSASREFVLPLESLDFHKVSKVAIDGLERDISAYQNSIIHLGLKPILCMDNTFINVVDTNVDKSSTLAGILNEKGIDSKDVFVFGDDIPDIEMMKFAGVSIAMGNAKEAVKAVADYIIDDCDEDAIGDFIRQQC